MASALITRGSKKTSGANCECINTGNFEVRINKVPLAKVTDNLMKGKFDEIIGLLGNEVVKGLDFNITTSKKGGFTAKIYAARQAFCRAILAYYGSFDEFKKQELKKIFYDFDRTTVVTDMRVKEPKKFGGPGARARYQKSYR
ncbi:RS16 [Hepatospora eriocheir]|uniref:RS16 n=1 Tax=Hepatospora eriocheir TaxID=1081669 RepID=A0A1X0QIZ1_9MICR|nr:RS16 [Hepatospora eriocheir]